MTFRIRACLATLACCLIPSLSHAQQFFRQCSTAPVALEARLSLSANPWDPVAVVAALVPSRKPMAVTTTLPTPLSPDDAVDEGTVCTFDQDNAAASNASGQTKCTGTPQPCPLASDCFGRVAEAPPIGELLGVDYCVPDALRSRLEVAKKLDALAGEEPVDVVSDEAAGTPEKGEAIGSFTVMVPTFAVDEPAVPESETSSDSPVVVTLVQQEEYLAYDLTAIDRMKLRIFPYGIPRYQARLQIPMQSGDSPEGVVDASSAEAATERTVAPETKAVEHSIPIDCLLDELVWRASTTLRAGSPFRQSLHPHRIGANLARLTGSVSEGAEQWIAALIPVAPPNGDVLNAPQPIQLAGQPSVCCPFNPEVCIAHLEPPSNAPRRELIDSDFLAGEDAPAAQDASAPAESHADPAEAAPDLAVEQWSDVVDEIVAAYAYAEAGTESEMELAAANAAATEADPDATADQWSGVVDEIVAAYAYAGAGSEQEMELTMAHPSPEGKAEIAADPADGVVEAAVAPMAGTVEREMERVLERAAQEWQRVLDVVQSLGDQWSERVATQPEANAVR